MASFFASPISAQAQPSSVQAQPSPGEEEAAKLRRDIRVLAGRVARVVSQRGFPDNDRDSARVQDDVRVFLDRVVAFQTSKDDKQVYQLLGGPDDTQQFRHMQQFKRFLAAITLPFSSDLRLPHRWLDIAECRLLGPCDSTIRYPFRHCLSSDWEPHFRREDFAVLQPPVELSHTLSALEEETRNFATALARSLFVLVKGDPTQNLAHLETVLKWFGYHAFGSWAVEGDEGLKRLVLVEADVGNIMRSSGLPTLSNSTTLCTRVLASTIPSLLQSLLQQPPAERGEATSITTSGGGTLSDPEQLLVSRFLGAFWKEAEKTSGMSALMSEAHEMCRQGKSNWWSFFSQAAQYQVTIDAFNSWYPQILEVFDILRYLGPMDPPGWFPLEWQFPASQAPVSQSSARFFHFPSVSWKPTPAASQVLLLDASPFGCRGLRSNRIN